MEIIVDVTLHKEDIEGDRQSVEAVRAENKEEVIKALEPLLKEGWKIHMTSSRVNL